MIPSVILIESGKGHPPELMSALDANGLQVVTCRSIFDLDKLCQEDYSGIVIVDLDDPSMNNRVLREMKTKRAGLQIIGISGCPFHPELKEAIATHIYACLREPVDPEELIYLVKSILRTEPSSE